MSFSCPVAAREEDVDEAHLEWLRSELAARDARILDLSRQLEQRERKKDHAAREAFAVSADRQDGQVAASAFVEASSRQDGQVAASASVEAPLCAKAGMPCLSTCADPVGVLRPISCPMHASSPVLTPPSHRAADGPEVHLRKFLTHAVSPFSAMTLPYEQLISGSRSSPRLVAEALAVVSPRCGNSSINEWQQSSIPFGSPYPYLASPRSHALLLKSPPDTGGSEVSDPVVVGGSAPLHATVQSRPGLRPLANPWLKSCQDLGQERSRSVPPADRLRVCGSGIEFENPDSLVSPVAVDTVPRLRLQRNLRSLSPPKGSSDVGSLAATSTSASPRHGAPPCISVSPSCVAPSSTHVSALSACVPDETQCVSSAAQSGSDCPAADRSVESVVPIEVSVCSYLQSLRASREEKTDPLCEKMVVDRLNDPIAMAVDRAAAAAALITALPPWLGRVADKSRDGAGKQSDDVCSRQALPSGVISDASPRCAVGSVPVDGDGAVGNALGGSADGCSTFRSSATRSPWSPRSAQPSVGAPRCSSRRSSPAQSPRARGNRQEVRQSPVAREGSGAGGSSKTACASKSSCRVPPIARGARGYDRGGIWR
eukprot:TRINITY_DN33666_c0_g1_i1.p1 TRINITY_DN33666_c0_g1~~TRINITY_DN33666_c0_g1_i1.p1  ORF type:complete len:625 (-),score=58.78 TRINITY_DN33666_c0_g1_i1:158-1957(-)